MAIHIMELNGKINNVVFYTRYGKNFARALPKEYKRTPAMQTRSSNFGIAAASGKMIRRVLDKIIPFPKDKTMQSGLSGAIAKWIGGREIKDILPETNIAWLADFEFNNKCRLVNRLKAALEVLNPSAGMLQLRVPAFIPIESIIAPEASVSVTLQVGVAAVKLERFVPGYNSFGSLEIPYNEISTGPHLIDLPINMESGNLLITVCALQYHVKQRSNVNTVISDKPAYMPATVVEARYC